MKKLVQASLIAALLATTLIGAAGANDPVELFPFFDQSITVQEGDDIYLSYYWDGVARGQLQMFFNHTSTTITLVDEGGNAILDLDPDAAADLWSPVVEIDPADIGLDCPQRRHWYTNVYYPLPDLAPGTYTLISEAVMTQPVMDGWHTCTSLATGAPASAPPSLYPSGTTFAGTVTITVQ